MSDTVYAVVVQSRSSRNVPAVVGQYGAAGLVQAWPTKVKRLGFARRKGPEVPYLPCRDPLLLEPDVGMIGIVATDHEGLDWPRFILRGDDREPYGCVGKRCPVDNSDGFRRSLLRADVFDVRGLLLSSALLAQPRAALSGVRAPLGGLPRSVGAVCAPERDEQRQRRNEG